MELAMETVTRWCGIAVLGFVVGCGSQGPSPPNSPSAGAPASGKVPAADASAGTPRSESPTGAESAPPAVSKPAPRPQIAPVPDGESPAPSASTLPSATTASSATAAPPATTSPSAIVEKPVGPSEAGATATVGQLRSWATTLAGGDVRTREAAAEALDQAAKAGHQPLWALLQDTSPQVRRGAIYYWLDRFNPADSEAVAALSKGLSDQDPAVRAMAMSAAQRFPAEAVAQALPQLSVLLTNRQNSAETRAAAARLIGTLEAQGGEAAGALAQAAVSDPDASVRSAGLLSLCRAAPADQAAAVLQQVLARDAQASIRGVAAVRLGKLGPSAAGAAPALAEALADRDEGVRRKAADALAALGAAAVTPAAGKLEAADAGVRRLAVFVLGKLGTTAKPALDALRKRLQDPDAEVKQLAELAIRRIEGTERN